MIRSLALHAIGVAIAAAVPSLVASSYYLDVLSSAAVMAMMALSVAIVFGQLGYPSFGHAAFLGLGAYTIGLTVAHLGVNYWALLPLAPAPGALLGLFVGLVAARLSGAYFAIATLVVAELLGLVASGWESLTRGPMGTMVKITQPPWKGLFGWSTQQAYVALLFVALAVMTIVLRNLFTSPTGRAWIAIREAPDLAEAVGVPSTRTKILAVMLSGAFASLAGALFVPKVFVISPELFGMNYSATAILAVILGGKAGVLGPVVGGIIFAVLPELFRPLGDWNYGAFALIMLVSVLLLPGGLASLVEKVLPRREALSIKGEVDPLEIRSAGEAGAPALVAQGVSRSFGGVRAVQDVSLTIKAGEIVGLIGPNGAGKTTLFHLLTGLHHLDGGRIEAIGNDITGMAPHKIARIGMVRTFQQTAVIADRTVLENVVTGAHMVEPPSFFASALRTPSYLRREERRLRVAGGCLQEVGLIERAGERAGDLPYGEQKLLGVAIALACRPRILLLDEPAAGLNAAEANRLAAALSDLRAKGLTLMIVDHNLPMLMSIADRIVVLHHGEKIADGTPAEITTDRQVVTAYLGGFAEKIAVTNA